MFRRILGLLLFPLLLSLQLSCSLFQKEPMPNPPNELPQPVIAILIMGKYAPLTVQFDGSRSSDPDGIITKYEWDFGDGDAATDAVVNHTYNQPGMLHISLTVTDDAGAQASATTSLVVPERVLTRQLYWTNLAAGRIERVDPDGANLETVVDGLASPVGIALDMASEKIYWTDGATNTIHRANLLDGSGMETLVSGISSPAGLALDLVNHTMYWAEPGANRIQSAELDGTKIRTIANGESVPKGIAVDLSQGKVYWTLWGEQSIRRANLDESEVETIVESLATPMSIAIDEVAGKIYWTDLDGDRIQRANLDGSEIQTLILGTSIPKGLALDVSEGMMYWTESETGHLLRRRMDGEGGVEVVTEAKGAEFLALGVPP